MTGQQPSPQPSERSAKSAPPHAGSSSSPEAGNGSLSPCTHTDAAGSDTPTTCSTEDGVRFMTASGSILDPALLSVDPAGHSEDLAAQQAYLAALTQPSSEPEQQLEAATPSLEPEQPPEAAAPSSEPEHQPEAAAPSSEPEQQREAVTPSSEPEQLLEAAALSLKPEPQPDEAAAPGSEPEQQPEAAAPSSEPEPQPDEATAPSMEAEQQPEEATQLAHAEEPTAPAASSDGVPEDPASPQGTSSERDDEAASQRAGGSSAAAEDGHSSQAETSQLLLAPAAERDRRWSAPAAIRRSARKRRPVRFLLDAYLQCTVNANGIEAQQTCRLDTECKKGAQWLCAQLLQCMCSQQDNLQRQTLVSSLQTLIEPCTNAGQTCRFRWGSNGTPGSFLP